MATRLNFLTKSTKRIVMVANFGHRTNYNTKCLTQFSPSEKDFYEIQKPEWPLDIYIYIYIVRIYVESEETYLPEYV